MAYEEFARLIANVYKTSETKLNLFINSFEVKNIY